MSVSEDSRPGRPSTSANDNHVERVRAVICGNHLAVQEFADEVGIGIGSCHQIFTEKLQMCRVSAKFVLCLLTDDQKENCVDISQELLANANGNENFLKSVITGVETWVYGYDVEMKMQSSQWIGEGSPQPKKKTQMSRSKVKVMLVLFFDWKVIVHHEFVPCGQMINKQLHQEVLTHLRDAVRRKRPELWQNQAWMLYHNNALAHTSLLICSYLAKHQTSIVPHPPYSPALAPGDFFLFPKLKTTLKGCRFQTIK